jgi:hypothetical protein
MRFVILVLAFFGILAVLGHVVRSGVWLLFRGIDTFVAGEAVDQRARRGDLTGMADASSRRALARRARIRAAATLSFWLGLLVIPVLTPWPATLYAIYSLLWFLPRIPRRA